ncbi:hypothetical protein QR680_014304 [Steinernema hermaphroditum]|uniref:Phlebovirus glycoprotein G2 fusion domain-containing protein n=1 Tax=Steinernema hermaphroditum TaxID=289476 RepID=A0AA39M401_9BILA|nr:hypothetical protein QR680_014304 [Steinernema hermaphroditum]
MVEVCSGKSCSYMQEPEKSQRLALPQEVMMFEHEVNVKMWKKGRLLQRIKKSCPSSPFCESFTCVVCLERLYNPQCISWVAIFLGIVAIGVTYYLLSILIKLLTISCMCCYFAFRWARGMKNWCCKYCRRDKTETVSIQLASSKSRFRYRPANSIATKIMIVMIVTLLTTGEDSCTDIPRGASLLAHFKEEAAAQLQITLDEFSASAMTSNTACEIEVFDFKGCYNCKTGAQMTYRCQSDFATAQADVKCGTNQFLALCTEQGSIGETWLSFGSRLVQETCTVSCPRRQTTFALEGRLNYIADTDASSLTLIDTLDTVRNVNGSIPWDQLFGSLSFLSSFNIFGKLWSSLSNVMNGIVLVVVIWMALYVRTIVTRIRSLYHVVVPKKVL